MKAIVQRQYGGPEVLKVEEVAKPAPTDDQVLVEVHAASINFPDWARLTGKPFIFRLMTAALFKPDVMVTGADIAGRVEAVGPAVTQFQPGDQVFADVSNFGWGGFSEYVSVPQEALVHKPANLSYAQAAAVPMSGVLALQGIRDLGAVQAGQRVLVVGASSGNGTFLVQVAKAFGAEVTGVCGTRNVEMVRSLGADRVIDYTREDFGAMNQHWDLVAANSGYRPLRDYVRVLSASGTYMVTGGAMKQVFEPMLLGPFMRKEKGQRVANLSHKQSRQDLNTVKEMIEAGQVTPVVDRCFSLHEASQAFAYYGQRHASGKVVISVKPETD